MEIVATQRVVYIYNAADAANRQRMISTTNVVQVWVPTTWIERNHAYFVEITSFLLKTILYACKLI